MTLSLLVYLSILTGSSLFFVATLFSGDGEMDHDGSHDVGGHDHDGFHDTGDSDADADDADTDDTDGHDHEEQERSGNALREILSIRNLFLFGVGFGAAGSISSALGQGLIVTLFLSTLFGTGFMYVCFHTLRFFYKRELNTVNSVSQFLGEEGQVTVTIPAGGLGEIFAQNGLGGNAYVMARSIDDEPVPFGSKVLVERSQEGVLYVSRIREIGNR